MAKVVQGSNTTKQFQNFNTLLTEKLFTQCHSVDNQRPEKYLSLVDIVEWANELPCITTTFGALENISSISKETYLRYKRENLRIFKSGIFAGTKQESIKNTPVLQFGDLDFKPTDGTDKGGRDGNNHKFYYDDDAREKIRESLKKHSVCTGFSLSGIGSWFVLHIPTLANVIDGKRRREIAVLAFLELEKKIELETGYRVFFDLAQAGTNQTRIINYQYGKKIVLNDLNAFNTYSPQLPIHIQKTAQSSNNGIQTANTRTSTYTNTKLTPQIITKIAELENGFVQGERHANIRRISNAVGAMFEEEGIAEGSTLEQEVKEVIAALAEKLFDPSEWKARKDSEIDTIRSGIETGRKEYRKVQNTYRVITPDHVLEINEKLSEKESELLDLIRNGKNKILLIAPMGTGKSYFASRVLIKLAKESSVNGKVGIVVPVVSIAAQLEAEGIPALYGNKSLNEIKTAGKLPDVLVGTAERMVEVLEFYPFQVPDEAHQAITDKHKPGMINKSYLHTERYTPEKQIILTATPDPLLLDYYGECTVIQVNVREKREVNYFFHTSDTVKAALALIRESEGGKTLIRLDDKNKCKELKKHLNKAGIKDVAIITAEDKETSEYTSITQKNTLKNQITLVTSWMNAGVNLYDDELRVIGALSVKSNDVRSNVQFIGRDRLKKAKAYIGLLKFENKRYKPIDAVSELEYRLMAGKSLAELYARQGYDHKDRDGNQIRRDRVYFDTFSEKWQVDRAGIFQSVYDEKNNSYKPEVLIHEANINFINFTYWEYTKPKEDTSQSRKEVKQEKETLENNVHEQLNNNLNNVLKYVAAKTQDTKLVASIWALVGQQLPENDFINEFHPIYTENKKFVESWVSIVIRAIHENFGTEILEQPTPKKASEMLRKLCTLRNVVDPENGVQKRSGKVVKRVLNIMQKRKKFTLAEIRKAVNDDMKSIKAQPYNNSELKLTIELLEHTSKMRDRYALFEVGEINKNLEKIIFTRLSRNSLIEYKLSNEKQVFFT